MAKFLLMLLILTAGGPGAQTMAQDTQLDGAHPDSHGPTAEPAPAPRARHRRAASHAAAIHHARPSRRWHMTAGHITTCQHHYRSYNRRTNRYVGRTGVRHVCVL